MCQGARGLLGISRGELAALSRVSVTTIAEFETGKRRPYDRTLEALREALERQGIEFVDDPDKPGVLLRRGDR